MKKYEILTFHASIMPLDIGINIAGWIYSVSEGDNELRSSESAAIGISSERAALIVLRDALRAVEEECEVDISTSSQQVFETIQRGFVNEHDVNSDLWKQILYEVEKREVRLVLAPSLDEKLPDSVVNLLRRIECGEGFSIDDLDYTPEPWRQVVKYVVQPPFPFMDFECSLQFGLKLFHFSDPLGIMQKVRKGFRPTKLDEARDLLSILLTNGPASYSEIVKEIRKRGIPHRTVMQAKRELQIVSIPGLKGDFYWEFRERLDANLSQTSGWEMSQN